MMMMIIISFNKYLLIKYKANCLSSSSHHRSPRNPDGLTSLWVGNVLPEVKQEQLQKMFSK